MTRLTVLTAAFAACVTTFAAKADYLYASLGSDDAGRAASAAMQTGMDPAERPIGMTAEEVFHASKAAAADEKGEPRKVAGLAVWKSEPYSTIIERYAVQLGISVSLAHAVIRVESNYRPYALGKAGEVGLMQIKPATARLMGYSGSATGLFDPETNIKFGLKYLAKAQRLGDGSTCGTILKYNAGHSAKRMNPVSLDYCSKVKRHLAGV